MCSFKHALPAVCVQVFLTTLSDLQMRECLQDIDSWTLFANLNELCLVQNILMYYDQVTSLRQNHHCFSKGFGHL